MCQVKYLYSGTDPEEERVARQLRQAGIDFVCAPTSGPVMLCVNGAVRYGVTAVREAVQDLVAARSAGQAPLAI